MDAKTLVGRVAGLYTLPEVYRQLSRMLEEGEGNECDLAELISYDPVLTARLFQLAAELHTDIQCASVSEALALLGGVGLQRRLDSTAAEAVFSKVPVDIVDMHDFWHHSVCCAMAAEALSRRHDHLVPETMFLAGLQGIPDELHQAARVDGATGLQGYFRVTLPLLMPVIMIAGILRTIWIFNFYDLPWVMTRGGPAGSTETPPVYAYLRAFSGYRLGEGSTITILLFLILMIFALIYFRMRKRAITS